jgi:putative oxidoreductase
MRLKLDIGLLILRVGVAAFMFFSHGWPKLMKYSYLASKFPDPIGLGSQLSLTMAIFAEAFCALLVMLGLVTRLAVIPLAFTMLVAALVVHSADPWSKKEFALLYFIPFVALFFTGPGMFSLDAFLKDKSALFRP